MPRNLLISPALTVLIIFLIACSSPPEVIPTSVTNPEISDDETAAQLEEVETALPESSSYPGPPQTLSQTPVPEPYPQVQAPTQPTPIPTHESASNTNGSVYLPITGSSTNSSETESLPTPEPQPTVDFAAVRADLQAQGQDIGFIKAGFHVTLPENREVLDEWMIRLDEAGIPFFLKTVDNAEPLFKAQELMRKSGVPHVLVYRSTGSVPHYELTPQEAAQHHWATHRDLFPPELDPSLVWIETLNEPDRTQSEWLAQFAMETAQLAMAEGFRWAAFGWASGEPEEEHWQGPSMTAFLRFAADNRDHVAIALHEYSYIKEDIGHEYPYKIGRFQKLFEITDALGIPRPTVLITEWGWEHADIPPVEDALEDIKWVSELYAAYPEVKGAAIWNVGVGCCFGDISEQVQEIIDPLTELSLRYYFAIPATQQPVDPARFNP